MALPHSGVSHSSSYKERAVLLHLHLKRFAGRAIGGLDGVSYKSDLFLFVSDADRSKRSRNQYCVKIAFVVSVAQDAEAAFIVIHLHFCDVPAVADVVCGHLQRQPNFQFLGTDKGSFWSSICSKGLNRLRIKFGLNCEKK